MKEIIFHEQYRNVENELKYSNILKKEIDEKYDIDCKINYKKYGHHIKFYVTYKKNYNIDYIIIYDVLKRIREKMLINILNMIEKIK